jgi:hypothetical protein
MASVESREEPALTYLSVSLTWLLFVTFFVWQNDQVDFFSIDSGCIAPLVYFDCHTELQKKEHPKIQLSNELGCPISLWAGAYGHRPISPQPSGFRFRSRYPGRRLAVELATGNPQRTQGPNRTFPSWRFQCFFCRFGISL